MMFLNPDASTFLITYNQGMIFDGKKFALEIERRVTKEVAKLPNKPKIASILVGNDPASELYTKLKSAAAKRCGITFTVHRLSGDEGISARIAELATTVDGVMVQMPIPGLSRVEQQHVLGSIPLDKDVDGLRWEESRIMPATVRAILTIIEEIETLQNISIKNKKVVLIGTHGSVGKPLVYFLDQWGVKNIVAVNSDANEPARTIFEGEVVISCVGRAGLVTGQMVRNGVIAIDVGISRVDGRIVGDMTPEVYQKASVALPVPGGVGPVTVASLMSNTLMLASGGSG
jgi:methylenetetrahydrofolate dehydrogenase (NADP+) / methenyltetrahydrofolate cyclohydrolase